jgi:hypothetical protein
VPRHDAPVVRRLAKELVVPKADWAVEQLRCWRQERWVPENVMQSRLNPPRAERMKQDGVRIARFVAVILVPQLGAVVARLHEIGQFCPESFDLALVEKPNSGQKPVSAKLLDLPRIDLKRLPFGSRRRLREEVAHWGAKLR